MSECESVCTYVLIFFSKMVFVIVFTVRRDECIRADRPADHTDYNFLHIRVDAIAMNSKEMKFCT